MNTYASNSELRTAFVGLSHWVWNSLGDAHRLDLSFNEETITESLLLSLARAFSHRGVSIKSFNKYEEGISFAGGAPTGADWEFWFTDYTGQWLGVRIQAKRLYLKSGRYEGLDGTGTQLHQLVSASGFAIPLYLFYNGPSHNSGLFPMHLPPHKCCRACGWPFALQELWGCAFAMPDSIPFKNMPKPSDIRDMLPWHCIWCWASWSHRDYPTSLTRQLGRILRTAYNRSRRFRRFDDTDFEPRPSRQFEPIQTPPDWVTQLDEGMEPRYLPIDISGIAIIRDQRKLEPR